MIVIWSTDGDGVDILADLVEEFAIVEEGLGFGEFLLLGRTETLFIDIANGNDVSEAFGIGGIGVPFAADADTGKADAFVGRGAVGGTNPAVTEPALTRLRAAGLSVTPRTLPGEPDAVLGRLIAEDGFDLLVMGAYGHSRIRTLIIGSTTTAMIQTVRAPVLLYR